MRIGRNPLTSAGVPDRGKVICAVITHLPNDYQQYHKHRFQIIALSLESLRKHANMDIHLAVWDNGSHAGFRDWLANEFKPDTMVLSDNVGKSVARKALFGMFEPDTFMCMADDDMFYFPNWLLPQLELHQHFDDASPRVGTVTGYPVRTSYRWANDGTMKFGKNFGKLENGNFIQQEWDLDFCTSIGRDYDKHVQTSRDVTEYRITYKGKQALAIGHHCQFVCINGRIAPLLRWDNGAMPDEKPFDRAVDASYMRLCTPNRLTMHMGNMLDDKLREFARRYGLSIPGGIEAPSQPNAGIVRDGSHIAAAVGNAPVPKISI